MEDKDDLGELRLVESLFDDSVAVPNILGCIIEISLNETLNNIKKYTVTI